MAKRSSISPTLTVFGVWWVGTAYFAPTYDWHSMVQSATVVGFGVLLGAVAALTAIAVIRMGYRTVVSPTELRGLRCTIGEVPLPMPEPARSEALPSISPVTVPDIPADFVDNWLDEYAAEYPQHAALFKALLRVLNHRPDLPATHVAGGHGGRTLLQHSMLTSWVITEVSRTWSYDGLRDRTGKRILLPLRDPEYRFNPHDPMVAIIGLAHDIGKIESFVYTDGGDVVGIGAEHDLTGSRMIARMPETWAIPAMDRDAMLLAIAHYHHPVDLPLVPAQRKAVARDDRTIALMELLIRADFTVTSIENRGVQPTDDEYRSLDSVRSVSVEQLYEEFVSLIHEAHRVNSGNIKYSVGQISPSPDEKGALLYLHEESLRVNMMRRLGLQTTENLGNGRYQITVDLLNMLNARGVLYTTHEGLAYSPGNAMWVCEVLGSKNQKIANWPCVIAVKLDAFEKLQQLGFFSSSIKIVRNRFGAHMGKPVAAAARETVVVGGLGSSNDIPDAPAPKPKRKGAKAGAIKPGLQTAPTAPTPPAVVAKPAPTALEASAIQVQDPPGRVEPVLRMPEIADDAQRDAGAVMPAAPAQGAVSEVPVVTAEVPDISTTPPEPVAAVEDAPASLAEAPTPAVAKKQPAKAVDEQPAANAAAANIDGEEVINALGLAITQGEAGILKCRQGTNGSRVFNLNDLLGPDSLASPVLGAPGIVDYIAADRIKGAGLVRLQGITLVTVTPPLSSV